MIKAAVLGSPISHSLSPLLHRTAYELLGIPSKYEAIELTPERARGFFLTAMEEEWTGFSLTMPLKETVIDLGAELGFEIDSTTLRMRSANTLLLKGQTYLLTSTDRSAFARLLAEVKKERVAIIGGGGTARAALAALDGVASEIDFLLRSPQRRELLARVATLTKVNFFGMERTLKGYDLVISTVPSGASDSIALSLDCKIPTFLEVLYRPTPTPLLARFRELGSQTIDGMDLLVEQALDQISLFSETEFDIAAMRNELLKVGRPHLN